MKTMAKAVGLLLAALLILALVLSRPAFVAFLLAIVVLAGPLGLLFAGTAFLGVCLLPILAKWVLVGGLLVQSVAITAYLAARELGEFYVGMFE